jgi:molybdopterin-guanine dinucleotide biosynthesis protein A
MKKIPCFILVGGRASRFGKDKTTLFYRFLYIKCRTIFKEVKFVAKRKKYRNYPFFIEKSRIYAPIFPLLELLKKYPAVFILSGDTPFLSSLQLGRLRSSLRVARGNPLVGVYLRKRDWYQLKRRAQTDYRLQKIAPDIPIHSFQLENINTLEQWRKLKNFLPPYYKLIARLK